MNGPIFLDSYVKGPFFWHPGICTYFSLGDFSLGIICIDCDICVITSNKWVQKIKGQYMNRSTVYEWVRFFKGQVYEWGRF